MLISLSQSLFARNRCYCKKDIDGSVVSSFNTVIDHKSDTRCGEPTLGFYHFVLLWNISSNTETTFSIFRGLLFEVCLSWKFDDVA